MFLDLFLALVLSILVTIAVKRYFGESGLSAFPVLMFLTITVLSYMATAGAHGLLKGMGVV